MIDFASNDYLGLARCPRQHALVQSAYSDLSCTSSLGATGSRLLSGDSDLARLLEANLAKVHNRPASLLFNSGYDANLSVLSSLPYRHDGDDAIVMDNLVHNSLIMGVRMGRLANDRVFLFRHNDVADLKRVLDEVLATSSSPSILVVVESVYSMDGDVAPLKEIFNLCQEKGAGVMVDEAHGLGVYGHTNVQDFVHTFGKAAGCHGAVVAGSETLISYLVNYARPFVYSTALPPHSLVSIQQTYKSMMGPEGESRRRIVFQLVKLFRAEMAKGLVVLNEQFPGLEFDMLPSPSPIQAVIVPGNERCIQVCRYLRDVGGLDVYPIRSPTVPKGMERIRIILHSHNTENEVHQLTKML
ncbi:oxononanoate synthase, partial [Thalassiosira pseudonana CCMP1335]